MVYVYACVYMYTIPPIVWLIANRGPPIIVPASENYYLCIINEQRMTSLQNTVAPLPLPEIYILHGALRLVLI